MEGEDNAKEEIKLIKILLIHDAKLDKVEQEIKDLGSKFDFFKNQIQDKEAWIRKLIYLIIAVLGSLAGAGGFIKAIIGVP